jgi:hypothetical protein
MTTIDKDRKVRATALRRKLREIGELLPGFIPDSAETARMRENGNDNEWDDDRQQHWLINPTTGVKLTLMYTYRHYVAKGPRIYIAIKWGDVDPQQALVSSAREEIKKADGVTWGVDRDVKAIAADFARRVQPTIDKYLPEIAKIADKRNQYRASRDLVAERIVKLFGGDIDKDQHGPKFDGDTDIRLRYGKNESKLPKAISSLKVSYGGHVDINFGSLDVDMAIKVLQCFVDNAKLADRDE